MKINGEGLPKAYGYAKLNGQIDKRESNNGNVRISSDASGKRDTIEISGAKGEAISAHQNTYRNINDLDSNRMVRFARTTPDETASEAEAEVVVASENKADISMTQESVKNDNDETYGLSSVGFRFAQKIAELKMDVRMRYGGGKVTADNYDEEYEKTLKSVIEMMRGGTVEGNSQADKSGVTGEEKTDIGNINIAKVEADIREELFKDANFIKKNGLDFELVFQGRVYETISEMTREDYVNISVDDYLADRTLGSKALPFYIPDENNPDSFKAVDRDSNEAKAYVNKLVEDRNKANDEYVKYKELKADSTDIQ